MNSSTQRSARNRRSIPINPVTLVSRRRTEATIAIDMQIGGRIRECRLLRNLTQDQFADLIGVTMQQMHKYERGLNRISASRLFQISRVLQVPMSYFFNEAEAAPIDVPQGAIQALRAWSRLGDSERTTALAMMIAMGPKGG